MAQVGCFQCIGAAAVLRRHTRERLCKVLRACHNRMLVQMSKALSALLRTSFEISTTRKDGPKNSLPLHRAVLDAVIDHNPVKAEKASVIDSSM